ncbi:MAG: hypothetical protein ACK5LO_08760 [Leucobacter sp.]
MSPVVGVVMVGAGAVCLGGAALSRHRIGIAAATVMLLAMIDLAFLGVVPALVWAAALVAAGLLLGVGMRLEERRAAESAPAGAAVDPAPGRLTESRAEPDAAYAEAPLPEEGARRARLGLTRGAVIASALAYVAAAWLVVGHSGGHALGVAGARAGSGSGGHGWHGGASVLTSTAPLVLVTVLCALLAVLCAMLLRRRRRLLAAETGGMAAMLAAMLLP